MTPSISVLGTGGTIACTADARGDLVPTRSITDLLQDAGVSPDTVVPRDVLQLDSSSMSLSDLDSLLSSVHAAVQDGPVVVTHGTDSMEETAMAVDRLVGGPRPADDPSPDGPGNLRDAVAAASRVASPVVALGGGLVPAYGVRKVHTTADRAFSSAGAVRPGTLPSAPAPLAGLRVDIIPASQGADSRLLDAAVDHGADGIVVEAFGSGNVGGLAPGVQRAVAAGVPVVVASRVPAGGVHLVYGGAGGGREMERSGVRSAGELSPAQARMELLCGLAVARCPTRGS